MNTLTINANSLLGTYSDEQNSQSASSFILKLDTIKQLQKWDNDTATKYFPLFLKKTAIAWYLSQNKRVKENYQLLKETFLETFDSNAKLHNVIKLLSRKQKENETVKNYILDIYKLFSVKCMSDIPDGQKIAIFINGLRQELRHFVISKTQQN